VVGFNVQLRSALSATLDRGESLASHPGRFTVGQRDPVTREYEAAWDPYSFWMQCKRENYLFDIGNHLSSSP
jgi:hypothetical protein